MEVEALHEPARSAGWQPAVSPTGSRQTVRRPAGCQPATQQTASLRYMLGKNRESPAATDAPGAFFLESSQDQKAYLQSHFTNWVPRVEVWTSNNVQITKTNVIDRVTGKPAKLFWARVVAHSNQTAQAVGGWHFSAVAGGQFNYQLVFNGTNWVVSSKKSGVVW